MVLAAIAGQNVVATRRGYERIIRIYAEQCFRARRRASVSELAARLGENRPAVSRRVIQLFGKPLGELLRDLQFAYAIQLLTTTPLPVAEVGRAAAFGDATSFFRAFRKRYGMTPAEYRMNPPECK